MYLILSFVILLSIKLFIISNYGVNLPYWDQWDAELDKLYIPFANNQLKIANLFEQHNEHRIFFTRLLCLSTYVITQEWNTLLLMKLQAVVFSIYQVFIIFIYNKYFRNIFSAIILIIIFCIPLTTENLLWGFQSHIFFLLLFTSLSFYLESTYKFRKLGIMFSFFSFLSLANGLFTPICIFIINIYKIYSQKTYRKINNIRHTFYYFFLIIFLAYLIKPVDGHKIYKADNFFNFLNGIFYIISWPNFSYTIALIIVISICHLFIKYRYKVRDQMSYFISLNSLFFIISISALSYSRNNVRFGFMEERYVDFLSFGFVNFYFTSSYLIKRLNINKFVLLIPGNYLLLVIFLYFQKPILTTKHQFLERSNLKKKYQEFISGKNQDLENFQRLELGNLYPFEKNFIQIHKKNNGKVKINLN